VLALSFARSTASMSFALRFSVLPLVDSVMQLTSDHEMDLDDRVIPQAAVLEQACELEHSSISIQRFSVTKYFETELQRPSKPRIRKTPNS
jgi:hypothetical protein